MYALLPALVSGLFLAFGIWVLVAKGFNRVTLSFFLLCMCTFFWQGTWSILFSTKDPELGMQLIRFGYVLIAFLPTTMYHFLVEVSGRQREHRWVCLSYAIATGFALMSIASDWLVSGYHDYFFGYYPKAGDLHPLHVLQTILVALRGLHITWLQQRTSSGAQEFRLRLCIISLLIYTFAAVDYLCNYGLPFYPPGVLFVTVSLGLMTFAITRYDLFNPMELAASVAHEMRTPLASIRMQAEVIAQQMPDLLRGYQLAVEHGLMPARPHASAPARIERVLHNINHEVSRSNTVIDMMLASSRLEHIDSSSFEWLSVRDCVKEAIDAYPFQPGERSLVSFKGDGNFRFLGSRHLFVCVLFNLFKNALYAMKAAGKGNITVQIDSDESGYQLIVSDTASGIAADVLAHIFDPFYTTKKANGSGAGLGLAFCRRAINAFGGQMSCESRLGEYTSFTMQFAPDRIQTVRRHMQSLPS